MPKLFATLLAMFIPLVAAAAFAQDTSRPLGTVERVDGDRFVVKWNDGAPLVVKIVDGADQISARERRIAVNAKSFLEYQYVEIKDLSKQFLIVIAGFLTLTVTFSEKLLGLATASAWTRVALAGIWGSSLAAFALGGAAIFAIYNAGIQAKAAVVHHQLLVVPLAPGLPPTTYVDKLVLAQTVLTWGGLSFVFSLFLLVCLGVARFWSAGAAAQAASAD